MLQVVAGKLADGGPQVEVSIVEDADDCVMRTGILFLFNKWALAFRHGRGEIAAYRPEPNARS